MSTSVVMDEAEKKKITMKSKQSQFNDSHSITSYEISPHQKGEKSFSDDEEEEEEQEEEDALPSSLDQSGSIFGFSGSQVEPLVHDNVIHSNTKEPFKEKKKPSHKVMKSIIDTQQLLSDIKIQSALYSEAVVTRSLEMMWFVMVAAEDIRPKKIVIRNYVKEVLSLGLDRIQGLKETTETFVNDCLWQGYEQATQSIIFKHQMIARQVIGNKCIQRSFHIAQSLIINNYVEKEKRLFGMKKILNHDLSTAMVSRILSEQVKLSSIRQIACQQYIQNISQTIIISILQNLQPIMCSYERFHEILEESSLGSIGAAVYTIEMKVIPTRNALKCVQQSDQSLSRHHQNNLIGAVPVGTGFALAKAKKTAKDIIELEIYNLQTKETLTHFYHSRNGEYASINDAIYDATQNLDGVNPLLFESTTLIFETDQNIDGRSYHLKLFRDEKNYVTLLEMSDVRMKSVLTIQLTKKQEKEIEYVHNITEYIQHLFNHTDQFLGYSNIREALVQKGGTKTLIASDLLSTKKKAPEVLLEVEEITINYQPYNLKVTEDEMGIRLEVWNMKVGKVVGTRLTKRQERDFQEVHDRQQFLVNLLGTPGFTFLL
jgi:hypothetical protein